MDLAMFSRKIVTIETIEKLVQFIGFIGSVHWENCLCVTIYIPAHQLHTTPHASHIIIPRETTFYFLFILLLLFPNFLFQFLLYRPIFFLIILLERKFLPVYDTFNSFSYSGFVIWEHFYSFLWNCTLYTEFNISTH